MLFSLLSFWVDLWLSVCYCGRLSFLLALRCQILRSGVSYLLSVGWVEFEDSGQSLSGSTDDVVVPFLRLSVVDDDYRHVGESAFGEILT